MLFAKRRGRSYLSTFLTFLNNDLGTGSYNSSLQNPFTFFIRRLHKGTLIFSCMFRGSLKKKTYVKQYRIIANKTTYQQEKNENVRKLHLWTHSSQRSVHFCFNRNEWTFRTDSYCPQTLLFPHAFREVNVALHHYELIRTKNHKPELFLFFLAFFLLLQMDSLVLPMFRTAPTCFHFYTLGGISCCDLFYSRRRKLYHTQDISVSHVFVFWSHQ